MSSQPFLRCRMRRPVVAILFNCAEPEAITKAFESLQGSSVDDNTGSNNILLGAYANRLAPVASDWTLADSETPQPMRDDLSPKQYYQEFASVWKSRFGVQLIGGCCGMTPEHIQYLHEKFA